jgi:hypothetical protein
MSKEGTIAKAVRLHLVALLTIAKKKKNLILEGTIYPAN